MSKPGITIEIPGFGRATGQQAEKIKKRLVAAGATVDVRNLRVPPL